MSERLKEQIVQQPLVKHKPVYRGGQPKQDETIYITDEDDLSTTDDFIEDDEDSYPRYHRRTRQVSILRKSSK